jgi:hypothetical protein
MKSLEEFKWTGIAGSRMSVQDRLEKRNTNEKKQE